MKYLSTRFPLPTLLCAGYSVMLIFFYILITLMYRKICKYFFYERDKANKRSGHLMLSDYGCPRPRATPQELQVRYRPLRWDGRRSPALPDAERSGIKPLLNASFKCREW